MADPNAQPPAGGDQVSYEQVLGAILRTQKAMAEGAKRTAEENAATRAELAKLQRKAEELAEAAKKGGGGVPAAVPGKREADGTTTFRLDGLSWTLRPDGHISSAQ